MDQNMKHMLEKGPSPTGRIIMSNMGIDPDSFVGGMREGIRQIEQEEQTPVEIHFYHCDHLGTPIALTDRKGQIVWAARYDPWGNIEEEFNPHNIEQNIRLPGQHHDRETGLYYNRHRYYDPKIGAYINQDPIGLGGGTNVYGYGHHNPLNIIDPIGLFGYGRSMGEKYLGHGDFYCNNIFDYASLDRDRSPMIPIFNTPLHFRNLSDVESDLQKILDSDNGCDLFKDYEYLKHQGQDYFVHYRNGYRGAVGHLFAGSEPDKDEISFIEADIWTRKWADAWTEKCGGSCALGTLGRNSE
jgi:RHS repeat-associated protein